MEIHRGGFRGGNYKQHMPSYPQGKGKQPMAGQNRPFCKSCRRHHDGPCILENVWRYGCGELGHRMNNCPKAAWNQSRTLPTADQQRPPTSAPEGRPLAPGVSQQPRNFKKRQARGQVYCIEAGEEESEYPHVVVSGTFVVNTLPTKVLFDVGATHSFINPATAKQIACVLEEMDIQYV